MQPLHAGHCGLHHHRVSGANPASACGQVPPALPTLPLCCAAAAWHACPLVVDWHNFAYTLMALSLGPRHFVVRPACM